MTELIRDDGLGPLVNTLAEWEDENGSMAGILPSEWDDLKQRVMDACVHQSPRQLRMQIHRLWKDAERYRWLRDMGDGTWMPLVKLLGNSSHEIDEAIDQAREKG